MEGEFSIAYGWLIAGAVFLALEAFGAPGIGLLFAGLSAVLVGILVHLNAINDGDMLMQAGAFGGITALLALLLWRKLKQWRLSPSSQDQFSNIVGDLATIGKDGIEKDKPGQASWSGTTMMARLSPDCGQDRIEEGTMVEIVAVKGNHLIVAPRSKDT